MVSIETNRIGNTSELLFISEQAINIIMYPLLYKDNRWGKKVLLEVHGEKSAPQHKIPRALVKRRGSRGAAPPGIWMSMDIMVGAPWASWKIIQVLDVCYISQTDGIHEISMFFILAKLEETSRCHPQQEDLSPLTYAALGLLQVLPGAGADDKGGGVCLWAQRQDQISM